MGPYSKLCFTLACLLCLVGSSYANNAIYVNTDTQNGKHVQLAITQWGSDWYFSICSVIGATCLGIIAASHRKPRTDRVFFYLYSAICGVATIAYFAMGSNLGWTPIDVEWRRTGPAWAGMHGINREIFYARYIDWFVTTPLLLLDLLLTAGLPWPSILWVTFLDEVMVVSGLIGALVKTRYKWGFYAFGCFAMAGVFYELAIVGRRNARKLGKDVHRTFVLCGVWTLFIWFLYPVSWGLCEGGNVITPDDEAVFYGCLDFCAKPIFSILLLWGHWNIEPSRLGLRIASADELITDKDTSYGRHVGNGAASNNGVTSGENTG
ncbi:hypothetical protein M433DRAFT_75763 [Acidomyces richmondensis BFW]|nr:hypothetical protein M433DRAFT_75763 [Acidomyces richmondensis BFW]